MCTHHDSSLAWHAIRTKPRQEWRAAENLNGWGIESLSPSLLCRAKRVVPLFPGYIFARFDVCRMWHNISYTRGIAYIVSFGGVPAIVRDEIIEAIRERVGRDGLLRPDLPFKSGDRVLICSGPLQGFVGVFDRGLSDNERVRILLTTLAYTAKVDIPWQDARALGA